MRQVRQAEAKDAWFDSDRRSIINACPRFGKIKTSIEIMKDMDVGTVLIVYPRTDIKDGWEKDFEKWGYKPPVTEYSTYRSLDKAVLNNWDLIIYDELHEASDAQLDVIAGIDKRIPVLGLTGTITSKTESQIWDKTGIDVCYRYSIDQGVEEGILCDYTIHVHHIPLDNKVAYIKRASGKVLTEKKAFDNLDYAIKKLKEKRQNTFFMELKKIAMVQSSLAKREFTKRLLAAYNNERVLVFCGVQEIADALGIPSYHSGNKNKQVLDAFCNGEGLHLATIKMMQAGVTITPINKGVINYTSGNPEDSAQKICRFLGFEYNTPDKKAEIHVVCTTEKFEIERIRTALLFFNQEKINLINFPYEQQKEQTVKKTAIMSTAVTGKKRNNY